MERKGEENKRYVALFGFPMDNSTRAKSFTSKEEIEKYAKEWKDICYFIVAFKSTDYIMEL